jgi:hypothetical protein
MIYSIKLEESSNENFDQFLKAKNCTRKEALLSTFSKQSGKCVEELSVAWDNSLQIKFIHGEDIFEVLNS